MLRGALLLTLLPGVTLAQSVQERRMGVEWASTKGHPMEASISVALTSLMPPTADVARWPSIDRRRSGYEKGLFPLPVGDDEFRAEIRVRFSIAADGTATGCEVTKFSGIQTLDAHACPHLRQHLTLTPGLSSEGTRFGGAVELSVTYSSGRFFVLAPDGKALRGKDRDAIPLKPIDRQAVGFSRIDGLPDHIESVSGQLRVEQNGSVSACTLTSTTEDDRFDLSVCERLKIWRFSPALNSKGRAHAANYPFWVRRWR